MKIYKLIPISIVAIALSGCGTGEATRTSAYGVEAYKVKCKNTPEACLEQASSKCGDRYTALYSDSHAGGYLADIIPAQTTWYALTFKCGGTGERPRFPWAGTTTQEAISAMDALGRAGQNNKIINTNCHRFGSNINCTSY